MLPPRFRRTALAVALCLLLTLLPSAAGAAFSDVAPGSWYEDAITQMEAKNILNGYADGTFRPDQTISAAEFVTIAARQAGLSPVAGQTNHWAAGHLEAARLAGWYDWDEIPPTGQTFDQPISRQLAVKILMAALLPDATGDYATQAPKIRDLADLDGRYYNPVFAAYAAGIAAGDQFGCFRPKNGLSRAEACTLFLRAGLPSAPVKPDPTPTPSVTVRGGVSENGWLQVKGTQLCNQAGQPVLLRGMSTHGLHWFGSFASAQSIQNTAARGANLFRVAMYTGEGGYLSQPAAVKAQLVAAVDAAIQADLYVIIDWHILSDGNPAAHTDQAVAFFTEMAQRYGDNPAVLFEICNEPNGNITWSGNVKPYAQRVVSAIRAYAPRSIILVGSPTWSQDIHQAAADPLQGTNLMYTLHFYAGTHGDWLRQRADQALAQGLPLFVSEWGTSRADGSGGVYLAESRQWLDFLESRGISWANWSLCDKNETSAALKPGTSPYKVWTDSDLTPSGQFVFSRLSS